MGLHCDNCDKALTKKSVWHCGCVMCPDLPAATPQNKALSQWVRATHSPVFVVFRTRFVKYCPTTAGPSDTVGVSVCVWTCEPTLSFCGNDLSQGAGGSQAETRSTDLLRQRCCLLLLIKRHEWSIIIINTSHPRTSYFYRWLVTESTEILGPVENALS